MEIPETAFQQSPTDQDKEPFDGPRRETVLSRNGFKECKPSFAQERLWFLEQVNPGNTAYNIIVVFRLRGALDIAALTAALAEIVRRHEVLRTHFEIVNGEPLQRIDPVPESLLEVEEVLTCDGSENELRRLAEEEATRPFDLTRSPLFRARLLKLGENANALLLCMHHIISDGLSLQLLMRELESAYAAFKQKQPPALAELPIQYADYAVWQRDNLKGAPLQAHIQYWRKHLEHLSPLILPTDRPRPMVRSYRGATETFSIYREVIVGLQTIAQGERATLFMALLAVFQAVLGRWSGEEDIAVGTGVANRNREELETLIGLFVNTLVLRTDLSGNPTFRELLSRVRQVALRAYAHQDLPFERLVEELAPERNLSRSPFFDVLFGFNRTPACELTLPGVSVESIPLPLTRSKFDLTLVFNEKEGQVTGALTYDTSLFEATTIRRMVTHIQRAMDCAATAPEQPIASWDLLTDEERQWLLIDWNQTPATYSRDRCVHELFEEQAARTPDALAVMAQGERLTYGELNNRAEAIAVLLIRAGVRPEDRVGVCLERSTDLAAGLLGILKAGGVYLPLDPEYPLERLDWMLKDSQAVVVLTQQSLLGHITQPGTPCLLIDGESRGPEAPARLYQRPQVRPENLAYIIYTSGSTGTPKGVMVQHESLVNTLTHAARSYDFREDDVWAVLASFSFDISLLELMTPWMVGAASLILSREEVLDAGLFTRKVEEATSFLAVPSLMRHIISHLSETATAHRRLRLIRVFTGGERVSPDLVRDMSEQFPDSRLIILYGPTEATLICAGEQASRPADVKRALIGRPIANLRIYILDRYMQPVPLGVSGELYVGGVGLARGYLNRPDLTAQRFVPDPFANEPGTRLYRTGDVGRYDAHGSIEFIGRTDEQTKIRGYRIEPAEVDAALSQCGGVRACVTIAHEDASGESQLVSYVILEPGAETATLLDSLRNKLPAHMLPAALVPIEAIPMTANGKLNRKALPPPSTTRPRAAYVAPQTPIERRLAAIWSKVLGVHPVGMQDGFFELGGHSLSLARLRDAVSNEFACRLSMVDMFRFPTVRAMAQRIEGLAAEPAHGPGAQGTALMAARDRMRRLQERRSKPAEA